MYNKLWGSIIFVFVLYGVNGINILGIFDIPSKSVHILGHELLLGLAKRGHNVTLISAYPLESENTPNYTHVYIDGLEEFKEKNFGNVFQGQSNVGALSMINAQTDIVKISLRSKEMQDFLISDSKYDIIIQTYGMNEGYLGLAHHFDARVIGFVPFSNMPQIASLTGNSAPPSYVPSPILSLSQNMHFIDRLKNTLLNIFLNVLHKFYLFPKQEEICKAMFPDAPPLDQIISERMDLIFSNSHFSNETPRPKTPNIIYIGGYHVQATDPLPSDLRELLDNAHDGIVFLGFGTNVDTTKLPKEKLDAFINKFSKIPYKVLFKYGGTLSNKPKNVETAAWYPQRSILAHPNTKIFISHGGKGSATESLYFGVPTLCIPFFGDQSSNCDDIASYGYGIHLPYQEVTNDTFSNAFDELTTNPRYVRNAKLRSALSHEHEMDPLDRASFWIEHVYKFKGAKHLQPKSATMPLHQYLLLDVLSFILLTVALSVLLFFRIVKFILRHIFLKNQNENFVKTKKVKRN